MTRAKDTSKLVKAKIGIIKLMFISGCSTSEIEEKAEIPNLIYFMRRYPKYFRNIKFIKNREAEQNGATYRENENRV